MVFQYFVETASFLDFARLVCAFREYPLRAYLFKYKGKMIFSSRKILSNSILHFYTSSTKDGRYISYNTQDGRERADVVNSTATLTLYAPIVEIDTLPFPIKGSKRIKDKIKPIKIHGLGDLARLTYNPELPENIEPALYAFPYKKKWVVGYITELELDNRVYFFNYHELDSEPKLPFIKYSGHEGKATEFSDKFQHGYHYFPVIKLKKAHPIFGLK
jgi:hypothetical protein